MNKGKPRTRRNIQELQDEYSSGRDKKPLEDLMRAWKAIKELPPDDPRAAHLGIYHWLTYVQDGLVQARMRV